VSRAVVIRAGGVVLGSIGSDPHVVPVVVAIPAALGGLLASTDQPRGAVVAPDLILGSVAVVLPADVGVPEAHDEAVLGGDVKLPIEQVLVLKTGEFGHLDELRALIGRSHFITDRRMENLRLAAEAARVPYESAVAHTDPSTDMEGLYIKWEEDGEVKGRYKFVRESFTNSILDQDEHWLARPIIQNRLNDGSLEGMFQQ
jgi:hypothetical protein